MYKKLTTATTATVAIYTCMYRNGAEQQKPNKPNIITFLWRDSHCHHVDIGYYGYYGND